MQFVFKVDAFTVKNIETTVVQNYCFGEKLRQKELQPKFSEWNNNLNASTTKNRI